MLPVGKSVLPYVVAYLLWLVSIAACVAAFLQLSAAATALSAALGSNRYSVRLVSQVSLLVGGLAAFAYAVFLEGYYRDSVKRRTRRRGAGGAPPAQGVAVRRSRPGRWLARAGLEDLLRRFAITIAVPLGVLALSLVLLEIALRVIS